MKRKRKALYAKQKNSQNALNFFSSSVFFAEMKTAICVMLTNTGFLPNNFFRFSGWCAWYKMIQPLCPNWCNFFFNLSHVCEIYFVNSMTVLYFVSLCFLSFSTVSSYISVLIWREGRKVRGEKKKSVFHVRNSVTG